MANELLGEGPTVPTQDIPVDDAETQLLQVNIQVPGPIVAEPSEPPIGHCTVAFCRRLVCIIFSVVSCFIIYYAIHAIYAIYSFLKYDECCKIYSL